MLPLLQLTNLYLGLCTLGMMTAWPPLGNAVLLLQKRCVGMPLHVHHMHRGLARGTVLRCIDQTCSEGNEQPDELARLLLQF